MKLVYFIDGINGMGGMERIIIGKANALSKDYGHDVTIISAYSSEEPICYPIEDGVKVVGLDIKKAKHNCNIFLRFYEQVRVFVQTLSRSRKQISAIKPDVIFFIWVLGAMMLPFVGGKAKRIYESHSSLKNTPHHFFLRLMERYADVVVTLTEGNAKDFSHSKDVRVISNYTQQPDNVAIDYSKKRAIAVGRLSPEKGFDRLIRMWKNTESNHKDWTLDIIGDGPERESLQNQIEELGLKNSIRLCGYSEDIINEYANYSLFLMTSHAEGQGLVLLEAQATALPAVTFDFEYGASDVIKHQKNGLLIPQDDETLFENALNEIVNSESERRRMGQEGREVSKRFTKESIMKTWDELLSSL